MEYILYKNINEIEKLEGDMASKGNDIRELWKLCFGDPNSYIDFYMNWKVKDNQVLTVYKQDLIRSMLHLNPYRLRVQGKVVSSNYIVGVATRPEDRKKGLMKRLIETAMGQMYEEKIPFTYLMPAAEAIYLPFGFRIIYRQKPFSRIFRDAVNQVTREGIISVADINDDSNIYVKILEYHDILRLNELVLFSNMILSKNYDVYVERTSYYYKRLLHEMECMNGHILLCYSGRKLIGYLSYMTEDTINICESIYYEEKEEKVMKAFAEFILNKNYAEATKEQQKNDPPTIMARIINWEQFIRDIKSIEPTTIIIEVKDPILEGNNGCYSLNFTRAGCNITKSFSKPEISADIWDVTRLFFGEVKEWEINDLIVSLDKKIIIDKLKKIKFLKDVFINDVV